MAACSAVMLALHRGLTFYNDEFEWLTFGDGYQPSTLLNPHNGHLIAVPRALYETLPRLFGAEHLPFAVASLLGLLLCAGMFFAFVRDRIGGPAALALTIVLLFFGTSWNVIYASVGIPFIYSIALGVAVLVALDRDSPRWDVCAALLLALSIATHTFGVIFALGAATYLVQHPARLQRIWVVALPGALFVAWWVWALQFDQGIASSANIVGLPVYLAESFAAVLASLTGLNVSLGGAPADPELPPRYVWTAGLPLALVAGAALVLRVRRISPGPWFWALLVVLLSFWISAGLSADPPARLPTTPRYIFAGGVMLLLLVAEVMRGVRPGPRALVALYAVVAVSVAGNAIHLRDARDFLLAHTADARSQLAMVELAGEQGDLTLRLPGVAPLGARYVPIPAGTYLQGVPSIGSLAYQPNELRAQSEPTLEGADLVLARSLRLAAVPAPSGMRPSGCSTYPATEGGLATFPLAAGPNLMQSLRPGAVDLTIGRFAESPTVPVGLVSDASPALLQIPEDDSSVAWKGQAAGPVRLCGAASG